MIHRRINSLFCTPSQSTEIDVWTQNRERHFDIVESFEWRSDDTQNYDLCFKHVKTDHKHCIPAYTMQDLRDIARALEIKGIDEGDPTGLYHISLHYDDAQKFAEILIGKIKEIEEYL